MRKNRVRLSESQLRNLIRNSISRILKEEIDMGQCERMAPNKKTTAPKEAELRKKISRLRKQLDDAEDAESVKKIQSKIDSLKSYLKESAYREAPLRNDAGEVIDTGGWYDPDDYEDELWDEEWHNQDEAFYDFIKDVESGVYDDKIFDDKWVSNATDKFYDMDDNFYIWPYIEKRRTLISRDYAFKHGQPNRPNEYAIEPRSYENINVRNRRPQLTNDYYLDHEKRELGKQYPHTFRKDGSLRSYKSFKDVESTLLKDFIGTDQADKRPLHRKGSGNRLLQNMNYKKRV